jgi:hypothetical protein
MVFHLFFFHLEIITIVTAIGGTIGGLYPLIEGVEMWRQEGGRCILSSSHHPEGASMSPC